jgi:hypothetical protein
MKFQEHKDHMPPFKNPHYEVEKIRSQGFYRVLLPGLSIFREGFLTVFHDEVTLNFAVRSI